MLNVILEGGALNRCRSVSKSQSFDRALGHYWLFRFAGHGWRPARHTCGRRHIHWTGFHLHAPGRALVPLAEDYLSRGGLEHGSDRYSVVLADILTGIDHAHHVAVAHIG